MVNLERNTHPCFPTANNPSYITLKIMNGGPFQCCFQNINSYSKSDSVYNPLSCTAIHWSSTVAPEIVSTTVHVNPTVEAGSNLTIGCTATGYPAPTYEWVRLDQALPSRAIGVETSSLTIPNVTVEDFGQYACIVTNIAGISQSEPLIIGKAITHTAIQ